MMTNEELRLLGHIYSGDGLGIYFGLPEKAVAEIKRLKAAASDASKNLNEFLIHGHIHTGDDAYMQAVQSLLKDMLQ